MMVAMTLLNSCATLDASSPTLLSRWAWSSCWRSESVSLAGAGGAVWGSSSCPVVVVMGIRSPMRQGRGVGESANATPAQENVSAGVKRPLHPNGTIVP